MAYNPSDFMWRHPMLWLVAAAIALAGWFLYFSNW
jgi:hypothetical protein